MVFTEKCFFSPSGNHFTFWGYCNLFLDMNHIYHKTKQHVIYNFLLLNEKGKYFPFAEI